MTHTLEDQLREAFQAAARTVRSETIRPGVQYRRIPPVTRRFGMLAPLAAAAAVVAAIGAAIAVPQLVAGSGHPGPATATTPATTGTAPFLAEVAGAGGSQLAIQQAGTTHVTALVPPPDGAFAWTAVAAAGDTTFIGAAMFSGSGHGAALYRLTLTAEGKLSQLTRVSSGIPGEVTGLAASEDGHRIAYATSPGIRDDPITLNVITGTATRRWTVPMISGPGSTGLMPSSVSLAADGSELGFIIFRVADTVGPVRAAGTMWVLPVDSAPGSATARGHKVTTGPPGSAPFGTVLSADGRTLYVLSGTVWAPNSAPPGRPESVILSAYSTADGTLLRTIYTWAGIPSAVSIDPSMTISGGQLLVWGVGSSSAYQVDPASGTTRPVWVYSLHDKKVAGSGPVIAW